MAQTLAEIRRAIDAIDDQVHDLLMERAALVAGVQKAKADTTGLFLRPGREAQILRRLAARHKGELSRTALARIWRELIGGLYHLQGGLRVGVHGGAQPLATFDAARQHFGADAVITVHDEAQALLQDLARPGTVGVMAVPRDGTAETWWLHLMGEAPGTARIIGRVPLTGGDLDAFVLATVAPEASGDDHSLLAVSVRAESMSRARVANLLREAGFDPTVLASVAGENLSLLFDVPGFVAADDPRRNLFARLAHDAQGIVTPIGAYATPITLPSKESAS
jgi:chorismate mutase/prephenate dehydratase